jgi:hypothetical protein
MYVGKNYILNSAHCFDFRLVWRNHYVVNFENLKSRVTVKRVDTSENC